MSASARRRVLVLTHHYRPEPNFITADVAESLARSFDVTVVTPHANYPEGRFYPGTPYWRPARTREHGVTIWRLPFLPYRGRSHVGRAVSYLSFALLAAMWSPFVAPRPEIVWVYHGPFTVGLAAIWFRRVIGSRIVFTCADLWPESFLAAEVAGPGRVMRLLFAYSRAINRVAHTLICSTRGTLARYARDGVAASALHYIPVWVEGIGASSAERRHEDEPEGRTIVYAGNLGPAQKLDTLIRAAAAMHRDGLPVRVAIYGTGISEADLRRLARDEGAANVEFFGRVTPEQAFDAASRAFAQVVSLQPSPLFAMTIPSKVSFSCAAAAPLLYGLPGEASQLVAESGGGIAFDPSDPDSLVAAVRVLLSLTAEQRTEMRRNLRCYYERQFAREGLLARYNDIFHRLAAADCDMPAVAASPDATEPKDRG